MRKSLVIVAATLGCSLEPVATAELPLVPNNPLISFLASEPSTYVMSRLGTDESSPFRINQTVCLGLPRHTDVVDSIFFNGEGSYRRVYYNYNRSWRTIGVPEPVEMFGYSKFEHLGTVGGEGNVLKLIILQTRQHEDSFQPFPADRPNQMAFSISGAMFTKGETLGTGCHGERTATIAEFTRASE
jgi:hypothetical protein